MDNQKGLSVAIIEVTQRCQLRCPGCYMINFGALTTKHMSLEQAVGLLDLCFEYRGSELDKVYLLGGEPLLWPHLKEYIKELVKRNITVWLVTNMLTITPEFASWLFEHGVKVQGKLNVSPDDDDWEVKQAKLVGSNERIAKSMLACVEIFLNVGYKNPDFIIENLIRSTNVKDAPALYRWCLERGIGSDVEILGNGKEHTPEYFDMLPTQQQLLDMLVAIKEIQKEFGIETNKVLMPHISKSCKLFDTALYFMVDGNIRACSNSPTILANTSQADPVKKAFESSIICNRRSLNIDNIGEPCNTCDRWDECRGGCRSTAEGTGNPFAGYEICPVPALTKAGGD